MDPTRCQQFLSPLLSPMAALYGSLMGVRRKIWESGLLRRYRPSSPCVSIGNIAWGGTGKTPLAGWFMEWALRRGVKPVVLSRGYKADPSVVPLRVSSRHTVRETGDEPLMLALECPEADVLVDPRRSRAAAYAEKSLQPGLLLLDDGFQHLAMDRHADLVLLRPADVEDQWNRVIPAGSWREGRAALSRADAFLIKAAPEKMRELAPLLREKLADFQRPVFSFFLRPTGLRRVGEVGELTAEAFGGRPYVLVSGVGEPQQVRDTAEAFTGRAPEKHFVFPDHHTFLFRDADSIGALKLPVICTAKDAVKLRHVPIPDLWTLRVEVTFGPWLWSEKTFPSWWAELWEKLAEQRGVDWTRPAPKAIPGRMDGVSADAAGKSVCSATAEAVAGSHQVPETPISGDSRSVPDLIDRESETEKHDGQTCHANSRQTRADTGNAASVGPQRPSDKP